MVNPIDRTPSSGEPSPASSAKAVSTLSSYTQQTTDSLANDRNAGGVTRTTGRAVWLGRILFLLSLALLAFALGVATYYILRNTETKLAEKQFRSLANRATVAAAEVLNNKLLGSVSIATIAGYSAPDPNTWPDIAIRGYEDMSSRIVASTKGRQQAVLPIVTPEQREGFEAHAYDWMHVNRVPEPFPNTTGVSNFGKGIWERGDTSNPDGRVPATTMGSTYDSPNQFFAPIIHITSGARPVLMWDLHSSEVRGRAMDAVLACSNVRAATGNTSQQCIDMTDPLILATADELVDGLGAVIITPIYPADSPFTLKGFTVSSLLWTDVLDGVVESGVSGVDCVIEASNTTFAFRITNGIPRPVDSGQCHDPAFNKYGISIDLTCDLFTNTTSKYTLTMYPSTKFMDVYSTTNPILAGVGAACIIVLTSLLFILYDFFVRREFTAKQDLLRAKRDFMRFVSHEVRTPLNSVMLGSKLVCDEMNGTMERLLSANEDESSPEVETANKSNTSSEVDRVSREKIGDWITLMKGISANTDSAVEVLNELLQWDKIEAGKLSLELSEIRISELTRTTTNEFQIMAQKKNLQLVFEETNEGTTRLGSDLESATPSEMVVIGDSVRLVQCIRNLVSNALKFSCEHGTVKVKVNFHRGKGPRKNEMFTMHDGTIPTYEGAGEIDITVIDEGAGMDKSQLEGLFRDGVQFARNKLQGGQGSGLGLYVTKGLIEQHKGTLTATSSGHNKGTTFTIHLPVFGSRKIESSGDLSQHESSEEVSDNFDGTPVERRPMRILIVDDAVMNRKLLARLLSKEGHVCQQAENGNEACRVVAEATQPFDTILMDKEMPECDGPTAAKRLRDMGCDTFLVGLTGSVLPEDVDLFRRCGANHILPKPFRLDDLEDLWIEYNVQGSIIPSSHQWKKNTT